MVDAQLEIMKGNANYINDNGEMLGFRRDPYNQALYPDPRPAVGAPAIPGGWNRRNEEDDLDTILRGFRARDHLMDQRGKLYMKAFQRIRRFCTHFLRGPTFHLELFHLLWQNPGIGGAGRNMSSTFISYHFQNNGVAMTAPQRYAYFRDGFPGGDRAFDFFADSLIQRNADGTPMRDNGLLIKYGSATNIVQGRGGPLSFVFRPSNISSTAAGGAYIFLYKKAARQGAPDAFLGHLSLMNPIRNPQVAPAIPAPLVGEYHFIKPNVPVAPFRAFPRRRNRAGALEPTPQAAPEPTLGGDGFPDPNTGINMHYHITDACFDIHEYCRFEDSVTISTTKRSYVLNSERVYARNNTPILAVTYHYDDYPKPIPNVPHLITKYVYFSPASGRRQITERGPIDLANEPTQAEMDEPTRLAAGVAQSNEAIAAAIARITAELPPVVQNAAGGRHYRKTHKAKKSTKRMSKRKTYKTKTSRG